MKGKLYLVSVSNLKKLPENVIIRLLITRKKLDIKGVYYAQSLAPSKELFGKYMREWRGKSPEMWWKKYSVVFNEELKKKKPQLKNIYEMLNVGIDVALICFCNSRACHRYLVADFLLHHYGIEIIDIV